MLKWLHTRRQKNNVAADIYKGLVAHARQPAFYLSYGVPDTMLGRFEMICLHSFLLFRRLGKTDRAGRILSQLIHDLMFADFDRTLREQGVGDMGIGKRVKKLAKNLYGRIAAYEAGLAGEPAELADALRRNLYGSVTPSGAEVEAMIAYIKSAIAGLDAQPAPDLMSGRVVFPDAAATPETEA